MGNFFEKVTDFLDTINEQIGRIVSWLTAILVIVVFTNVVMRYAFSNSKIWMTELSWHLFSLIFLLAAGYALRHNKHVRVDVFYAQFSTKRKALVDFLGSVIFLIPVCIMLITSGWQFAIRSFNIAERSAEANGLPALYIIKFSIVVGAVFLLLQGISLLIRSALTLLQPKPTSPIC